MVHSAQQINTLINRPLDATDGDYIVEFTQIFEKTRELPSTPRQAPGFANSAGVTDPSRFSLKMMARRSAPRSWWMPSVLLLVGMSLSSKAWANRLCFESVQSTRLSNQAQRSSIESEIAQLSLAQARIEQFLLRLEQDPSLPASPEAIDALLPNERSLLRRVESVTRSVLSGSEATRFRSEASGFRTTHSALLAAIDRLGKILRPGAITRTFRSEESQVERRERTEQVVAQCRAEALECSITLAAALKDYQALTSSLIEVANDIIFELGTARITHQRLSELQGQLSTETLKIAREAVEARLSNLHQVQISIEAVLRSQTTEFASLQFMLNSLETEVPKTLILFAARGATSAVLDIPLTINQRRAQEEFAKAEKTRIAVETRAAQKRHFEALIAGQQSTETKGPFFHLLEREIQAQRLLLDRREIAQQDPDNQISNSRMEEYIRDQQVSLWAMLRAGALPQRARFLPSQAFALLKLINDIHPKQNDQLELIRRRDITDYPGLFDFTRQMRIPDESRHLNLAGVLALRVLALTDFSQPASGAFAGHIRKEVEKTLVVGTRQETPEVEEVVDSSAWAGPFLRAAAERLLTQIPTQP